MKKFIILGILALALFTAGCTNQNNNQDQNHDNDQVIGGQRDEHGCLGPAGYSWNEEIKACARQWELDNDDKVRAAKTAVEYKGQAYGLTVESIEVLRCIGCYNVVLNNPEYEPETVNIRDWVAGLDDSDSINSFDECVAAGYTVIEVYPRECSANGKHFVENADGICEDHCGDGVCDEIVCLGTGCPCQENPAVCPEDCG